VESTNQWHENGSRPINNRTSRKIKYLDRYQKEWVNTRPDVYFGLFLINESYLFTIKAPHRAGCGGGVLLSVAFAHTNPTTYSQIAFS